MSEVKQIGVIGLGLIGGSIALDLKELGDQISGYDDNPTHIQKAMELGIITEGLELEDLCKQSDIIIVAIPVHFTGDMIKLVLNYIGWHTVVIDTGSTKKSICESVMSHTKRGRFVACHPLAGTEHSGPCLLYTSDAADE